MKIDRSMELSGLKFNRLTAIKRLRKDAAGCYIWLCVCECGKNAEVMVAHLTKGYIKSCGCLQREHIKRLAGGNRMAPGVASLRALYRGYKKKALSRGLLFELNLEQFEFITSKNCFYCNMPPSQIRSYKDAHLYNGYYIYNGIDRVKNDIGYVIDNCVPCCKHCNFSKNTMSQEDFFNMVRRIYEYHRTDMFDFPSTEQIARELHIDD